MQLNFYLHHEVEKFYTRFSSDNYWSYSFNNSRKSEFTEMLTTFFITGGVVKLVWDFIVNSDED